MVAAAWRGAADADAIILLIDAQRGIDAGARRIMTELETTKRKAILVLNKIDLVKPEQLLPLAADLDRHGLFTDTLMISAKTGDGVADLAALVAGRMPSGPWLYPEDQVADMPMRLLAAEITREQLFLQLDQELPYATAVETETWEEHRDGSVRIGQVIFVMRPTQKAIVLGKQGRQIKAIGAAARKEIEKTLDRRAPLVLFVKERPGWQDEREVYEIQGLEWDTGSKGRT